MVIHLPSALSVHIKLSFYKSNKFKIFYSHILYTIIDFISGFLICALRTAPLSPLVWFFLMFPDYLVYMLTVFIRTFIPQTTSLSKWKLPIAAVRQKEIPINLYIFTGHDRHLVTTLRSNVDLLDFSLDGIWWTDHWQ